MRRRVFLQCGLGAPFIAALQAKDFGGAADVLAKSVERKQVRAAALYVRHRKTVLSKNFGASTSPDDMFLLASITKTMSAAAIMTLYDQGKFRLDDPAKKFIPEFTGGGRDSITVRQLLTHVSGLPDQLPENTTLRRRHAKLSEFVERAIRTPLLFKPGSRYSYSSMAILVATEIAHRISGVGFLKFADDAVFRTLGMKRTAMGLGRFKLEDVVLNQTLSAAPESGSGDPTAKKWDWNSPYWRAFGAPWGGAHGSAADVARFLEEFLHPAGKILKPETARLMVRNHNREGLTSRGLGFVVGSRIGGPGCSGKTFGHSGSTGTLTWADPATDTICVVLTTLPGRAASPHPRKLASDFVAKTVS